LRVLCALRRADQVFGGSGVAGEANRAIKHHCVVAGLLEGHAGSTCRLTERGVRHLRPFEGVQVPIRITVPAAGPSEAFEVIGLEGLICIGFL
jgi:hypothetical protein